MAPTQPGPEVIKAPLDRIARLIRAESIEPARSQLRQYLNQHPDDAQALFLLGLTYHREQKYGQARPYFEQAIKADAGFPTTHYFLAWALYYLGETAGARAEFERFIQFNPLASDAYFGMGLIDLDEDQLPQAEQHFRKSIELALTVRDNPDPKDLSKAHTRLADVFERQDRLIEAKASRTVTPDMAVSMRRLAAAFAKRPGMRRAVQMQLVFRPPRRPEKSHALAPGVQALPWQEFVAG